MRRNVVAPPELVDAHRTFQASIRSAYLAFMKAKRDLGFCTNGSCFDRAEPDRSQCLFHSAYQARWQRRQTGAPRRVRVLCEAHGNYADVCGCPPDTAG